MPFLAKLIARNMFRHPLRATLTTVGIAVAILAFVMLRTLVGAWYAGVDATSASRLITRNAVSLVVPLPISYADKIRQVKGVTAVSYAQWFGGVYITERNFFPQFAIDTKHYFDLYPEFLITAEQKAEFLRDRKGVIAGARLVQQYGWKIGDSIPLRGTIYPGEWQFVLRGIYHGATPKIDQTNFFFHWDYLNESLRKQGLSRANHTGIFLIGIRDPETAPDVSKAVDEIFRNSLAETLTETEKAFQLGFVAMTEAIVIAVQIVSFVVVVIIMAVMANTMAMTARERKREYATLKALGFGPGFLVSLIFGESLFLAGVGGLIGILLSYPVARQIGSRLGDLFPVFRIADITIVTAVLAAVVIGLIAGVIPAWRSVRVPITEGLNSLG
jgi:putative ABC transport system permease protein